MAEQKGQANDATQTTTTQTATPQTEAAPQTDATVEAAAAAAASEARKKAIADKRAQLKEDIAAAKAKLAMPEAALEAFKQAVPTLYADMLNQVNVAEKALADYNLSVLSPEEAADIKALDDLFAARELAVKAYDTKLAECKTKYPDNEKWTTAAKAATKRAAPTASADGKVIPYSGREIPTAELETLVKEQVAKGVTAESDIVKAIFGEGFTINASKEASNPNGYNPRGRVHSLRVKLGLVTAK